MMQRSRGLALPIVVAIVAAVVLVFALMATVAIYFVVRSNEINNRVACSNNLRQIGRAMAIYTNMYSGYFPRTSYSGGPSVIPALSGQGGDTVDTDPFVTTTTTQAQFTNNVPEALYLLLRETQLQRNPAIFTCPSSAVAADNFGGGTNTALNQIDFSNIQKNLSYSYANPYPDNGALASGYNLKAGGVDATFVVAADINPGTSSATSNVLAPTMTSDASTLRQANSKNHGREGQNVLFGDYHVEWQATAFCGANHDNIYTRGGPAWNAPGQDVVDSPYVVNDTVLLPTDDNQ